MLKSRQLKKRSDNRMTIKDHEELQHDSLDSRSRTSLNTALGASPDVQHDALYPRVGEFQGLALERDADGR